MPFTDEDILREFVETAFGVDIPDKQICQNHTTPWRAFADAYFARTPITVWQASRGFGGKTFLLALLGATEAVSLGADVNILGGSGEQSRRVFAYTQSFLLSPTAPRGLLIGEVKTQTRLRNGAKIMALTASQKSVRGPHPQRLRLDEIDEMSLPILDASLGQPMSKGKIAPQAVLSSTHQNADGTMTEIKKRAKEKHWGFYEWCYRETMMPHGWLDPGEVEEKKSVVTSTMWDTEYEGQEPSPESRAILPEMVVKMFDKSLGVYGGHAREYVEIETPLSEATYATGADWARKQDWTVIVTLRTDVRPMRVVAFERRQREPWPLMIERFDERISRFPGQAAHDATGIGDVVAGYIRGSAQGNIMVGRFRSEMLSQYIKAIERGDIISPWIDYMESEHHYASVDDVYGSGHLPDSISAMANAYTVAEEGVYLR